MLKPLFILGLLQVFVLTSCAAAKLPEAPVSATKSAGDDSKVKLGSSEKDSQSDDEDVDTSDEDSSDTGNGSSNDDLDQITKDANQCQQDGYYYLAKDGVCDKTQKAISSGDLRECSNDYVLGSESKFLSDSNKTQLKDLFNGRLAGFQLKFCLQGDAQNYKFVAWKTTDGEITTQELLIPK